MKKVIYLFPTSHHYRKPFHERLRQILLERNIEYRVVYSPPSGVSLAKGDTVDIEWGSVVPTIEFQKLKLQIAFKDIFRSDLIIIQQENSLLTNYLLNLLSIFGLKKVAFFGHGKNFQSRHPYGWAESWKKFWAKRVDWWFAYTDEAKRHVESIGFDKNAITVFNNSIDISELRSLVSRVSAERLQALRNDMGLIGCNVGIFVGGLYPDKRLEFLVEAADIIHARLPDFELLVIGGGPDLALMERLATARPWVRMMGPRFGIEKVELMMLGHVFLMPGLVGLAILDAGATRLPIATTRFPWHSPEISYLAPNENGLLVDNWTSALDYATAVADLLADPARRTAMADAAEAMSKRYTIEAMAENFAQGVVKALEARK